MTDAEITLRQLAASVYHDDEITYGHDGHPRKIHVTPYDGAYGLAGYVVAVNGSPPRGTFITTAYHGCVYITPDGRSRKMSERQAGMVYAYLKDAGYGLARPY